jgi:hypothetical protein
MNNAADNTTEDSCTQKDSDNLRKSPAEIWLMPDASNLLTQYIFKINNFLAVQ